MQELHYLAALSQFLHLPVILVLNLVRGFALWQHQPLLLDVLQVICVWSAPWRYSWQLRGGFSLTPERIVPVHHQVRNVLLIALFTDLMSVAIAAIHGTSPYLWVPAFAQLLPRAEWVISWLPEMVGLRLLVIGYLLNLVCFGGLAQILGNIGHYWIHLRDWVVECWNKLMASARVRAQRAQEGRASAKPRSKSPQGKPTPD